ncbi:hypothetical protein KKA66_02730 [Patescibacteria group bacterium]|nr:hypothetical protein [Patescibacteria group bacterium]
MSPYYQNISQQQQLYKQRHKSYINSDIFKNKKLKLLNIYKKNNWSIECVKCSSICSLQCHHNYYINDQTGHENISDIDYLCTRCHNEWHSIQKGSGMSQNNLVNEYYDFVFEDKNSYTCEEIKNLLLEKIKFDDEEINNYFSREDVIKYKRVENIIGILGVISFILIAVLIGIPIMIILFKIQEKNKKPENYDLYEQKRICIEIKKTFINQTK